MFDTILESLAIDLRVLLLNAGAFLILLVLMDRIFWKPIMRHLDQRNKRIKDAYGTVETTRAEMERLRADYEERVAAIEADARSRIQATLQAAQRVREAVIAEARAEAERIAREGQEKTEADRLAARAAAEERLERAAMEALGKAQGEPPDENQRQLIREYIRVRDARN